MKPMPTINSISQIIFCIQLLIIRLASGQITYSCNNTANFTSDSTYSRNLDVLLNKILRNTANSTGFFYSTSVGNGTSDEIYAHSFCQADFTVQRCSEVINDLVGAITKIYCPNQKEASVVGTYGLRYSIRPINGTVELEPTRYPTYLEDLNSEDNTTEFYEIWDGLMERVAESASRKMGIKFATREANFSDSDDRTMYSMMQCLPDLSASNCRYCLGQVVSYYRSWFAGKAGGYVQKPSCWFRWELHRFYENSTGVSPTPQLSPPPSPVRKVKDPIISPRNGGIASKSFEIIVGAVVSFLLLLMTLSYILYRNKKTSNYQHSKDFYEDTKILYAK